MRERRGQKERKWGWEKRDVRRMRQKGSAIKAKQAVTSYSVLDNIKIVFACGIKS